MMKTVGSASTARALQVNGQGEMEGAAPLRIRRNPERSAMILDDRLADGQSHSHAAKLRGEEAIENAIDHVGRDADCRCRTVDHDALRPVDGGAHA